MKNFRISSSLNRLVREAKAIRLRQNKNERGLFMIDGPHLVDMALNSGAVIKEVFLTESFVAKQENSKLLGAVSKYASRIVEVTEHVMSGLSDTQTPQGIVAVVSHKADKLHDLRPAGLPFFAVADGIQDPGNLGTIIRTSDAAGAAAVILLPGTCDVFMQKTIRASSGSIFNIPVVNAGTAELLKWAAERGIALAVTLPDAGTSIFEADLNRAVAFVFGSEARGVSEQIRGASGMSVKIPLYGKAESLNVATSAAICLYEAVRQRTAKR